MQYLNKLNPCNGHQQAITRILHWRRRRISPEDFPVPSQEEDTTLELSQTFDNILDLNTDSIKDQEYSLPSVPSDQLPPQSTSPSPSLPPTVNIMSLAGYYQSIPDNQ